MLFLLSLCLSGVFQGRLPRSCGNSWLGAVARFARVICFQLLKDPVVHSATEPNREAHQGWTSSGRMKDWRPVIDFFSSLPQFSLAFVWSPGRQMMCAENIICSIQALFPRLSRRKVVVSIFSGRRERWSQSLIHSAASNMLLQGVTQYLLKNCQKNYGVSANNFLQIQWFIKGEK